MTNQKRKPCIIFVILAMTIPLWVCLLLWSLMGCSTAPARYYPDRPIGYEHVGSLPVEEGDDMLVEVPVGTLKNALYVAEAYEALLPVVNQRGETMYLYANQILEQQATLRSVKTMAWIGTGAGVVAGMIVGAALWAR